MADVVKAQKLAAARKKLKEYQKNQSSKKTIKNDENVDSTEKCASSENVILKESIPSSTNCTFDPATLVQENYIINTKSQPSRDLFAVGIAESNFFDNELFQKNGNNITVDFFDTDKDSLDSVNTKLNSQITEDLSPSDESTIKLSNVEEIDNKNQNAVCVDYFELSDNQKQTSVQNSDCSVLQSSFEVETHSKQIDAHATNTVIEKDNMLPYRKHMTPEREKSECALEESLHLNNTNQSNIFSNTESLRQLSSQLNSLIYSDLSNNVTGISELEKRNQELASALKNEQLKTEQLNLQILEYKTRVNQLEIELKQVKTEYQTKISRETGPLQEQLQYHVQTVGILVGEKTELTIALNQSQATAKQKTSECEELQSRLKASRHRVAELEREITSLKSTRENIDKQEHEQNCEFERLKLEYKLLKEKYQEISEESSELREKLNFQISECSNLQQEIQEKNSQLSLAQLKIDQLTNVENVNIESRLEILSQQKISLEKQVYELTQNVDVITAERDQASQQYQQYVQQLNGQIQNLSECLETKNIENENLSKREQSLVKHIGELEKLLQNLQNEKETVSSKGNYHDIEMKFSDVINSLRNEKNELEEKFTEEMKRQNELVSELEQKNELIVELEMKVEELKDQPDASKLLAAMESDKIAASRAVEQNKKLKEQLEELHDGFIKMSNCKLELTEKLQSEQYLNKELSEKLSQNATTLEHLHSVIAIKDKELTEIQIRETELQKEILQQNQLADRLRHYEAQGNTSDFIQQEFQQCKLTVEKLSKENETLLTNFNKLQEEVNGGNDTHNERAVENLQLKEQLVELRKNNYELAPNLNTGTEETRLDKENAMQQLEERFKKTMTEIAELTEEKLRLEHLVLQLQSETETIGEYVTLYQCQRAMLKEKTLEKDEQLRRLSQDREAMKIKLDELNTLVQKLMVEKQILPKELLQHNLMKNKNICDIHKINNELKKEENETDKIAIGSNYDNNNENFGTAGKIITLLSEIKTSNLVQPSDNIQNFHPCPWCSGQLITV